MWVQSLYWKDPLEKEMATHSGVLGQRSLAGYSPQGRKESDTIVRLRMHTPITSYFGANLGDFPLSPATQR